VYEKGAEVVRMLHTLLGEADFRRGSDLYFERHDGQAVTCDDFLAAMADASGRDLSQFERWYTQAGTPRLTVRDDYDAATGRYRLTVRQATPATPGQTVKAPLVIPLAMGLLGEAGNLRLQLEGETLAGAGAGESADNTHRVLIIDREEQEFASSGCPSARCRRCCAASQRPCAWTSPTPAPTSWRSPVAMTMASYVGTRCSS
jgi:aminopeptidase N